MSWTDALVAELLDERERRLVEYVDRWTAVALAPAGPCDQDAARAAVYRLYATSGLPEPAVLFCGSPRELDATGLAINQRRVLPKRLPGLSRRLREAARTFPRASWLRLASNVREAPVKVGFVRFCDHLDSSGALDDAPNRRRTVFRFDREGAPQAEHDEFEGLVRATGARDRCFAINRVTNPVYRLDCWRLPFYTYAAEVLGLESLAVKVGGPDLDAQVQLALAAGFGVFRQRVVLLSDRPVTVKTDADLRLHCDDGPALVYPDGYSEYAIHGVKVPRAVIEDGVTLPMIEEEGNAEVRRVLIDRFGGVDAYLQAAGIPEYHRDRFGVLYRKTFRYGHSRAFAAVRVKNSTPEPDGTVREYVLQVSQNCRTARQAVAWTFGLSAREYAPTVET